MAEYIIERDDSLQHFGIKGQKWGVRRYENEDGTLTEAGKIRYAKAERDANQYKTADERMKKIGKSAVTGAVAGVSMITGANMSRYIKGDFRPTGWHKTLINGNHVNVRSGPGDIADTAIMAVLGAGAGVMVSGLKQGYEALKVKRGQAFVEKYKEAYNKTYSGGNSNG